MPLQPIVGRPAEVQAAGASLAAHQATRELPTAGPWAKFAANKKEEQEEEVKTPAAIADDAPSAPPSTSANDAASSAPAVLVQGLDFSYPDIGKREEIKSIRVPQREQERLRGNRVFHRRRPGVGRGALSASTFHFFPENLTFLSLS